MTIPQFEFAFVPETFNLSGQSEIISDPAIPTERNDATGELWGGTERKEMTE